MFAQWLVMVTLKKTSSRIHATDTTSQKGIQKADTKWSELKATAMNWKYTRPSEAKNRQKTIYNDNKIQWSKWNESKKQAIRKKINTI